MDVSVKKIIRNVTSSIVAIVAMFSVILTMGIVFFKTTLINENTYKNIFEKVGVYDEVLKSIEDNVTYALVVNNIKTDILDDLISKEEIVDAIDSVTYSVIGFLKGNDTVTSLDMGIYEKRVDDAINKYLRDNSMYLNESQKNDIENMKSSIINIIDSELQIVNFKELSSSAPIKLLSKIVNILNNNLVLIGFIIINALLLRVFFLIWKTRRVRGFAWMGYTLVSAGLIVFLISFSGYLSKFYEYAVIAIPYVANTVGVIIKTYLLNMSIISSVVIIIGLLSMSIYWKHLYRRYYNIYSNRAHKSL